MKKHEKAGYYFGIAVALVLAALALYWLTGKVGQTGARWWAALATLALPLAVGASWILASQSAREHLAGFDRGINTAERTITSVGRGLQTNANAAVRAAQQRAAPPPQPVDNSDLLPPVGQMIITEALPTGEVVNLG